MYVARKKSKDFMNMLALKEKVHLFGRRNTVRRYRHFLGRDNKM